MDRSSGEVFVSGSIAYVPQQAWIQNLTLRDNIVFNGVYNPEIYERVIDACALKADIATLPAGDETEIGEKVICIIDLWNMSFSLSVLCFQET